MSQVDTTNTGKAYWRSLDDLADAPEIQERIEKEFVGYDPEQWDGLSRRQFMKLMGASMALAGLTLSGCRRWPKETLAPYASRPIDQIPGTPEFYATAMDMGGYARPLLAETFDGRPIKLEGNPSHPLSHGSSDSFMQASVLSLYDPDRVQGVAKIGGKGPQSDDKTLGGALATPSSWDEAIKALRGRLTGNGAGFAILSAYSSSPSVSRLKSELLAKYPGLRWYEYEPINIDEQRAGAAMVYGQPARPYYKLEDADVIVTFDSDLLGTHPAHLAYAKGWAAGRSRADGDDGTMSRMYSVESSYSLTGAAADVRYNVRSSDIARILADVANKLGVSGARQISLTPRELEISNQLVTDLKASAGRSVVAVGSQHPAALHALAMLINEELGNVGKTVAILPEVESAQRSSIQSIAGLTQAMNAGQVQSILILGGNPAYDAPADLKFGEALAKVAFSAHLAVQGNETTAACGWLLPQAHYLEAWGDARAYDGSVTIVQPMIMPLFGGRSVLELTASLLGDEQPDALAIVRQTFGGGELDWRKALHDGIVEGSAPQPRSVQPRTNRQPENIDLSMLGDDRFEVVFLADSAVYDGRFANNAWLQELPRSITKLTWDNAAMVSVPDAAAMGITTGDMIRIAVGETSIDIAAYVLPGQAKGSIGLHLGYGRTAGGRIGTAVGFNVYPLRTTARPRIATGANVTVTGDSYKLVSTQDHHMIDPIGFKGRGERLPAIFRETTLDDYHHHPDFAKHRGPHVPMMLTDDGKVLPLQLYDPPADFGKGHQWGMTIDLNSCIGCNGCVAACVAENNIPVVGKQQVSVNREMHWLRIDRYFMSGVNEQGEIDAENPRVVHQPVLCMHCENAPCEQVCPVAATVHDTEGLNTMVYNRCIGTRYCSNNCPYKVRRFNYFDFHARKLDKGTIDKAPWLSMPDTEQREMVGKLERMVFNPDVTVRMRGVMEKCTFCVQRIEAAKVTAKVDFMNGKRASERVADGEVVTACQQSCPTNAIVFGDINDPGSRVRKLHQHQRSYALLEELNTRPRTRYLGRVNNPVSAADHKSEATDGVEAAAPAEGHS